VPSVCLAEVTNQSWRSVKQFAGASSMLWGLAYLSGKERTLWMAI
jgi:hypothetical protein